MACFSRFEFRFFWGFQLNSPLLVCCKEIVHSWARKFVSLKGDSEHGSPHPALPISTCFSSCADKRLLGYSLRVHSFCLYGTPCAGCEDLKLFVFSLYELSCILRIYEGPRKSRLQLISEMGSLVLHIVSRTPCALRSSWRSRTIRNCWPQSRHCWWRLFCFAFSLTG